MIHAERIRYLNQRDIRAGRYVLYWMQRAQRARYNHALEYAIREANRLRLPIVAVLGLTKRFPEANQRSYAFMLEGLLETQRALEARGIRLLVCERPPMQVVPILAREAALAVTDRGYLRVLRHWRQVVARRMACPLVQVETDAVVPADVVSQKEEYAARTIRPRIHRHLHDYLAPLEESVPVRESPDAVREGLDLADLEGLVAHLGVSRVARPSALIRGGASEAERLLARFLSDGLGRYDPDHNVPGLDGSSGLSPYLHFGQISPLEIALRVRDAGGVDLRQIDSFVEQLIVRRELAINFCLHNDQYDRYACLPSWARETLAAHRDDPRRYTYSPGQLERAETHDPYWNAAQREMLATGKMHGYMRMYWGKKILEWSPDPETAYGVVLVLNNRYEIDGRDPNGFAGVAWCFGKHDQAWRERAIYGKVRYMNAAGLERKFDMEAYLAYVTEREAEAAAAARSRS